jgi:hypothetical protein
MMRPTRLSLSPLFISMILGCASGGGGTGTGGTTASGGATAGGSAGSGTGGKGTGGSSSGSGGVSGSGGATTGGTGGTATGGRAGSGGALGSGGATGTGATAASGGAVGSGGAGGAGSGGATGAGGGATASGGAGGAVASDYPYCNYGSVPSGTAPAAWQDSPTLTPTGVNPYGTPSTTIPVGYILLSEGSMGVTQVPQATQSSILTRINNDLKFETGYSYIHLPPWSTGKSGTHYIDYLFVGTGLPNDPNAGGDSSYEGSYPDVETTSVAMTDQSQRYDLTHEFNHVLENSYGTVPGEKVSWIQESYNDYLILLTAENANGATPGQAAQFSLPSNVAYLDALVYQQPFAPIESCGIAVTDGSSVNGPADYFTDITGFRYNDLFPLFIAQRVGQHFFAAVWEQAKTTEQILQTMTRLTDKTRVQCMVQEYSARLALGDFGELSTSMQGVADAAMYQATTSGGGMLSPSNTKQLPRYTGRNNIPITVASGATQVSVTFMPSATGSNGTTSDMRAQIVYRATDGTSVFSPPVASGATSITLTKAPRNNVVIVVITNVTMDGYKGAKSYGWDPNETFGYQLSVIGGAPAPTNKKYF